MLRMSPSQTPPAPVRNILSPLMALLILVGLASSVPAETLTHKDRVTLPAHPGGTLTVDLSFHDIVIRAGSGSQVEISVEVEVNGSGDKAREFLEASSPVIEEKGSDIVVHLPSKKRSWWKSLTGTSMKVHGRVEITLPPEMNLDLDTASGDCDLEGDFGEIRVRCDTASGDVRIRGAMARLDVDTASGDLDAEFSRPLGSLNVDTASGDVEVTGLKGDANLDTASGDVVLRWDGVGELGEIRVDTASGGVRLYLPKEAKLAGFIGTASGDIDSDFPGKRLDRGHRFEFEGGPDAVRLVVDTASGDVEVRARQL